MLPKVNVEDVLEFGLIPELVGRLPICASLSPLDEESLVRVLTEPRNALTRQYESLFEMEGCTLEFTEKALRAIAPRAQKKATGARGLRSIIEEVMLDIMYDLPEQQGGGSFVLDDKIVAGEKALFKPTSSKAKASASKPKPKPRSKSA